MNLLDFRFDKYSSSGNDGIIQKIFELLEIRQGFFVEFGAWDGIKGSNCRKLYEEGWSGIFIEADHGKFQELFNNYRSEERVLCIENHVGIERCRFDNVVGGCIEGEMDFCSIDIDGLDVEVFETFERYLPKVVCIEGGQMLEPYCERVPKEIAQNNIQQSLFVMRQVFEIKGYVLLCSYQDSFFVKKEFQSKFNVSDDLLDLYLDGLKALSRRIPWICKVLKENKQSNSLLDRILINCDFQSFGYDKRKQWAIENKNIIDSEIECIRDEQKNHSSSIY